MTFAVQLQGETAANFSPSDIPGLGKGHSSPVLYPLTAVGFRSVCDRDCGFYEIKD